MYIRFAVRNRYNCDQGLIVLSLIILVHYFCEKVSSKRIKELGKNKDQQHTVLHSEWQFPQNSVRKKIILNSKPF